ncbi:MAG: hypothetical protein RBS36_05130 [Thiomicrospira sp.]|jgi:hypothetical protein|nr:hypothetical protein [Thiomicrospira sp.]
MSTLNVICVKWGTKYGPIYVNRLFNMVKKNLTKPFNFYCMTDDATGLTHDIRVLPIADTSLSGWWHKLSLFKSGFYGLQGTALYLDLDVVITGSLDPLIDYEPEHFCIMRDTGRNKWDKFNSSIMRFELGTLNYVWDGFVYNQKWIADNMEGDQDWIGLLVPSALTYPEKWVVSYKKHCHAQGWSMLGLGEWLMKKDWIKPQGMAVLPSDARVVVFHGLPNPQDVIQTSYKQWKKAPWIQNYWN